MCYGANILDISSFFIIFYSEDLYMRNYVTGIDVDCINFIKSKVEDFNPNVLRAYDHISSNQKLYNLMNNKGIYNTLACDSGTYVINSRNLIVNLNRNKSKKVEDYFMNYVSLLKKYYKNFVLYFNFDIMFNGEMSFTVNKEYQERLEKMGFSPVFVIHNFNNPIEVNYVLNKKPEYVAIASAVLKGKEFDNVIPCVKQFYDNGIKVHLLGCASYNHLIAAKYAWSCDASSYGQWASFNRAIFFSNITGKEETLALSKKTSDGEINEDYIHDKKNKELKDEYEQFISPLLPLKKICAGGKFLSCANAYYMTILEKIVTDYQKANGVEFGVW